MHVYPGPQEDRRVIYHYIFRQDFTFLYLGVTMCVYIYVCAFVWLYECIYGMYHYVFMYVCVCQYTLYLCRWTYVTCIARITYMTYTKCKTHMLDEVQRNIAFHYIRLHYLAGAQQGGMIHNNWKQSSHSLMPYVSHQQFICFYTTLHYITVCHKTCHCTRHSLHQIHL